jgi:hypothetical protein
MAKREAQARSFSPGKEMPATLGSAAEDHAQALKQQLLESTELAAQSLVGQTRAEGERRIEVAGRQAQAIAETVSAVEQAEQALAERARTFADASKALRAELKAFAGTLSEGEERLIPQATDEPDLKLVESPAPQRAPREDLPTGIGQILLAGEPDELVDEIEDDGAEDNRPEEEFEDDDEEEDSSGDGPQDSSEEEDDEDPPTPAEIAQFFREHEEAELAHAASLEREAQGQSGIGERLRRFFSGPLEEEGYEDEPVGEEPTRTRPDKPARPARDRSRDRLYTDIGGAVIGLGGAAALINFVLMK